MQHIFPLSFSLTRPSLSLSVNVGDPAKVISKHERSLANKAHLCNFNKRSNITAEINMFIASYKKTVSLTNLSNVTIHSDCAHPPNLEYELLPSGLCFKAPIAMKNRYKNFIPVSIQALNTNSRRR